VAIVLLTPAADRPFVGSTSDNNILNLTFGYNGLSRLTGSRGGFPGGAGRTVGRGLGAAAGEAARGPGAPGGGAGGVVGGGTGLTRLFGAEWGGQISWLIPAALIALAAMLWVSRRSARADRTRAAALMWGGWLVVAGLVLSYMSGTTHSYYSIVLAPPIGALAGIGAVGLWRIRHTWFARAAMAAALAATGAWAWVLLGRSPAWFPWLRVVIVAATVAAIGAILAGPVLRAGSARWSPALAVATVSLAAVAGLGGPLAYSLDTAASSYSGASPSAGPALTGGVFGPGRGGLPGRGAFPGAGQAGRDLADFPDGFGRGGRALGGFGGNPSVSSVLAKLLEAGAARYEWAAATDGSDSAASMELATGGTPVMAIGGFRGTDPAPSLAEFKKLVAAHKIHYYVADGAGGFAGLFGGGFDGGTGADGRFGDLGDFGGRGTGADGRYGDFGGRGAGADGRYGDFGGRGAGADATPSGFGGGAGGFGGGAGGFGGGATTDAAQISAWVEAHFTATTVGGETVYNLTAVPK
jgi:hypothetical protein